MSWHRVQEQWGSTQIQHGFTEVAGRWMEERDYGAWLGVRAIGEAVTRTNSPEVAKLRGDLRGPDFALGGFQGVGCSFRPWNQQKIGSGTRSEKVCPNGVVYVVGDSLKQKNTMQD